MTTLNKAKEIAKQAVQRIRTEKEFEDIVYDSFLDVQASERERIASMIERETCSDNNCECFSCPMLRQISSEIRKLS